MRKSNAEYQRAYRVRKNLTELASSEGWEPVVDALVFRKGEDVMVLDSDGEILTGG